MSKIMGYYALISSPTKVRLWDGFSWQGEVFEDVKFDVAGFVDNFDNPLIQTVDDGGSSPSTKSAPERTFSEILRSNMDEIAGNASNILVVTTHSVPGREIENVLGVVVGQGDAFFNTVKARHRNAIQSATEHLRQSAALMGADAVVATSYEVAGVRGFWGFSFIAQSVTVQISGTAVTLK